jgi:hypothetical protein
VKKIEEQRRLQKKEKEKGIGRAGVKWIAV